MKKKLLLALAALLLASPAYATSSNLYSDPVSGKVGIGTGSPSYTLDVLGSTTSTAGRFSTPSTDSTNLLLNNTTTGGASWYIGTAGSANVAGEAVGDFHVGLPGSGSFLLIGTGGNISVPNNLSITGTLSVTGAATLGNGSTASTQTAGDSSTKIATDAFVQTAITGSSGMVLLATVNASGASSVVFGSSYITSTYNKYVIEFDSAYTSDDGDLRLTFSTNNGSSYLSSSYFYTGEQWEMGTAGGGASAGPEIGGNPTSFTSASSADGGGNWIPLTGYEATTSSTSTQPAQGTITFSSPSASKNIIYDWRMSINANVLDGLLVIGGGNQSGTTAINALKIVDGSGGTITGNFHLYGLAGT